MKGDGPIKTTNNKELLIFLPLSAVVIGGLLFFYLGYAGQVSDYLSSAWTDFRGGMTAYGRAAVVVGLLLGIIFGVAGGWLVGRRLAQVAVKRAKAETERQALTEREAAAETQMQEARHTMAEAERISQAAQDEVQAAMEQVARREQEAAAQVEAAEFRLNRSVDTNIGRQKLIQKLRKQVNELKEQATMGHC